MLNWKAHLPGAEGGHNGARQPSCIGLAMNLLWRAPRLLGISIGHDVDHDLGVNLCLVRISQVLYAYIETHVCYVIPCQRQAYCMRA